MSRIFKDRHDKAWELSVNVATIKSCRDLLKVDLMDIEAFGKIAYDDVALVDVLYLMCREQADKQGVSDEEFGRSMHGESIGAGWDALIEDLSDFFRSPQKRETMRKALEKVRAIEARAQQMAAERLDDPKLTERIETVMDEAFRSETGTPSGDTPASSASWWT